MIRARAFFPSPRTNTYTAGGSFTLDQAVGIVSVKLAAAADVDLYLPDTFYPPTLEIFDEGGTGGANRIRIHAPADGSLSGVTGDDAYSDIDMAYGAARFRWIDTGTWMIA